MSNPIIENRQSLLYYLLVWSIITAFQLTILRAQFGFDWQTAIIDSLVSNGVYMILGFSFWYPCKFISLEKNNVLRILLNHIVASALAALLWLGAINFILTQLVSTEGYLDFFDRSLPWRLLIGILVYFVIVAFYYLLIYYQSFHEKVLRESELKSLVKEAQLKTLKFQINPHFIFNSLNSINSLILTMPENASEMTVKLSEFLRSTLSSNDIPTKPLGEELKTARLYLDIEKTRFGDRIHYSEDIGENALSVLVPNMLLQPLFENAVKHGVYESLETVHISFSADLDQQHLQLKLENDFDPENRPVKGEGVGLRNIRSRLEMIYNQTNLLQVEKEKTRFCIKIFIPI